MTPDIKELVERLTLNVPCFDSEGNKRKKPCGYDGGLCPECRKKQDAADALEALAGEVERWEKNHEALQDKIDSMRTCACQFDSSDAVCMAHSPALKAAEAERDRLKAALKTIAHRAGTFEGNGNYVAYVVLSCEIQDMALDALREGHSGEV
jgi:hypothetical protein